MNSRGTESSRRRKYKRPFEAQTDTEPLPNDRQADTSCLRRGQAPDSALPCGPGRPTGGPVGAGRREKGESRSLGSGRPWEHVCHTYRGAVNEVIQGVTGKDGK